MRSSISIAILIFAVCFTVPTASTNVLISQSGNDLLIDIIAPLNFSYFSATGQTNDLRVRFPDVYNSPVSLVSVVLSTVTSTISHPGGTSTSYGVTGQGIINNQSLSLWYKFMDRPTVTNGDTVTVSPGLVTLQNYFSDVNAVLPDVLVPQTAHLSFINGNVRSTIPIPEPSSVLLLTAGIAGFFMRRRRRRTA